VFGRIIEWGLDWWRFCGGGRDGGGVSPVWEAKVRREGEGEGLGGLGGFCKGEQECCRVRVGRLGNGDEVSKRWKGERLGELREVLSCTAHDVFWVN
jgi:hypothetical protein